MRKRNLSATAPVVDPSIVPSALGPPAKPLVFISHDSRDAQLAEAIGNLLTDASGGTLKSFRSSDRKGTAGIEFGAEWYKSIMDNLSTATDVVGLLTHNSINRPWILYEVGVAKGKLNTVAFGVALGIPLEKASSGPFAQFQNCADDEDSLTKLVLQLIRRNPDADPREEAVRRQVAAFRQSLDTLTKHSTKASSSSERVDETAVAKLFEEVKVLFRDLPDQVEGRLQANLRAARGPRRGRRMHPRLLEELLFHPPTDLPGDSATRWLLFVSVLRDDLPWFSEIGMEVYRALRSSDVEQVEAARMNLRTTLETMTRGPAAEMLGSDEDTFILTRHLPEITEHFLDRFCRRRPNKQKAIPAEKVRPSQDLEK